MANPDWQAWASFLGAIRGAETELGCVPDAERFYCGHANDGWPLLLTLQRLSQSGGILEVEASPL